MRILYEDTMPHGEAYFSTLGEAQSYQWQSLQPHHLIDVDVLAVRSTTKVTENLLSKANRLTHIATATAGFNHFDLTAIESGNIAWYAAGGCNAIAVAQYVVSALMFIKQNHDLDLSEVRVGIVGAGNVGSAVSQMLDILDIAYCLYDPPIQKNDPRTFVELNDILQCDIISLHVPYIAHGEHPTVNLFNEQILSSLHSRQWLINASRGEVIDEGALLTLKQKGKGPQLILDVWQNEPDISKALFDHVAIGTPHIAGHTLEGKVRGTQMVYDWLRGQLNMDIKTPLTLNHFLPDIEPINLQEKGSCLADLLLQVYDIQFDHRHFADNVAQSAAFSTIRKNYNGRREYTAYSIAANDSLTAPTRTVLANLGFDIKM